MNINYGWSQTITVSGGLDWNLVKDLLSANIGIQMSTTESQSATWTCNVPGYSVGQIWYQIIKGWGWIESQSCWSCNWCGSGCSNSWNGQGYGYAPALTYQNWWTQNIGCSTGYNNVQC